MPNQSIAIYQSIVGGVSVDREKFEKKKYKIKNTNQIVVHERPMCIFIIIK